MSKTAWLGSVSGDWSVSGNWSNGVPATGDYAFIPAGSPAITAGLNQSAVALAWLEIERGFRSNIASSTAWLQIGLSANAVLAPTGGAQYLDFGSSAYGAEIRSTGLASDGLRALNIKGSALTTVSVLGGSVGIATDPSLTATLTTLRVLGGNVWAGQGVSLTNVDLSGGSTLLDCAVTTLDAFAGIWEKRYGGTLATINQYSGDAYYSGGNVTAWNLYGGSIDSRRNGLARTISTLTVAPRRKCSLRIDRSVVAISSFVLPSDLFNASFELGA